MAHSVADRPGRLSPSLFVTNHNPPISTPMPAMLALAAPLRCQTIPYNGWNIHDLLLILPQACQWIGCNEDSNQVGQGIIPLVYEWIIPGPSVLQWASNISLSDLWPSPCCTNNGSWWNYLSNLKYRLGEYYNLRLSQDILRASPKAQPPLDLFSTRQQPHSLDCKIVGTWLNYNWPSLPAYLQLAFSGPDVGIEVPHTLHNKDKFDLLCHPF